MIQTAYDDKTNNVKAHSTRSVGPTWALFNGASIDSIMQAAVWSRESTFMKFYYRDIEPVVLKESSGQ